MAHPDVEKHWPELVALEETLKRLTAGSYGVGGSSGDQIIDAIKRYEKRNGTDWRQ